MSETHPSPKAKELLIDELREATSDEAVERSDVDVDRAVEAAGAKTPEIARSRLMFVVFAAVGVVVAGIAALALDNWVIFGVLMLLHATATAVVVTVAMRATSQGEKPAATTVAQLEHEGVADPEGALNELVDQTKRR
jgi:hypothetical protein